MHHCKINHSSSLQFRLVGAWLALAFVLSILPGSAGIAQAGNERIAQRMAPVAQGSVTLALNPATATVDVGSTMTVTVQMQAGTQPVDGVAAYLDFNPALLQVEQLALGGPLDTTLQQEYDNVAGHIDYAGGTFGSPPSGTFTVLQIRFRAIAAGTAPLQFQTTAQRRSEATHLGDTLPLSLEGAAVTAIVNTRPSVRFASSSFSVLENANTTPVTVTLSAATSLTVTVNYTAGTTTGRLTFPPAVTSRAFSVTIANNSLDEPNRVIALRLGNPTNATLGSPATATLTVVDDDPPVAVAFTAAAYTVTENVGATSIGVRLSAASGFTVTVGYVAGGATGTVVFPPNQVSRSLPVTVTDDLLDELDQVIPLSLRSPANATLGTPVTATLTVRDNDNPPAVRFASSFYTVTESVKTAPVTVTLSAPSGLTVTVSYTASTVTGRLTFNPGVTTRTFAVTITNDSLDEADEVIPLRIGNPVSATLGTPATARLTILDDDALPEVRFASGFYTVTESVKSAPVTVTLSAPSGLTVTVNYTAGAATGRLTFVPGTVVRTFGVTVTNDTLDEADEIVALRIGGPVNALLGAPATARLTIRDDDPPVTVRFARSAYTAGESSGTTPVTVTISAPSGLTVTVNYTAGTVAGRITITPGLTTGVIGVKITNDTKDEPNEVIPLRFGVLVNATPGAVMSATLTVVDDDPPVAVAFTAAAYTVTENVGVTSIGVRLSAASGFTVTVGYVAGGATGTVVFPPNQVSRTFPVTITDDLLDELDQVIPLTLRSPANATLGSPSAARLTVRDNDNPPAVRFASSFYTVTESVKTAPVTVTLSAPSGLTVTVSYTAGTVTGRLTYLPGVTTRTFAVTIINDALDEADEVIPLRIGNPVSATLGTPATARLTVLDDDPLPTVRFASGFYTVTESVKSAPVTVTLSAPSGLTVTVNYTAGAATGRLTFVPGTVARTFGVTVTNDTLDEADEIVALRIGGPVNALLGAPATARLTIRDDDPPVTVRFARGAYTAGESSGTAPVTVTLSAPSGLTVTVNYTAGAVAGRITITPGLTTGVIGVKITNDIKDEPNEVIPLRFGVLVNATPGAVMSAMLTVVDDDPPVAVAFTAAAYTVTENVGVTSIGVRLSAASGFTVTVGYVAGGATGTVVFPPNQVSRSFPVTITDDLLDELDQVISLTLRSPANATLGSPSAARLTVRDNDNPPAVRFASGFYTVTESVKTAPVTVTLSAPSGLTVTVSYTASTVTGRLTFNPGVTTRTFAVTIINDALDEADEVIPLRIGNPVSATLGTPATARLTVLDDDALPEVRFASGFYTVTESIKSAPVTVTLSAPSGLTVTVNYTAGAATGRLTFVPGTVVRTFGVTVTNDILDEADEIVALRIGGPVNALLGAPATARLTIRDDDPPVTVRFARSAYTAGESSGTAPVTVTLSAPSGLTITVNYTAGAVAGRITITPGLTTGVIGVKITNDVKDEPNEVIPLRFGVLVNATPGAVMSAMLTVVDDDPPVAVAFTAAAYTVTENVGVTSIGVRLSAASGFTVTVGYVAGGATGTVVFPPNQVSRSFPVTITDDLLDELDQVISLTLRSPANATLGSPSAARLTVRDNDNPPAVRFASSFYTVTESVKTAPVTVTLSAPSGLTVTVSYTASTVTGRLTFNPGVTTRTFAVTITNDSLDETDEVIPLRIGNPVSATLGTPATARLTVLDDDAPVTVQYSSYTYLVPESIGSAPVTVTLSAPSGLTVTVNYTAGTTAGRLTFLPGVTDLTFAIAVKQDNIDEPDEVIALYLSKPVNASLGSPSGAALIVLDDDAPPTVQVAGFGLTDREGEMTTVVTVTLSGPSAYTVTVNYNSSAGSGQVIFAPGETAQFIHLDIGGAAINPVSGVMLHSPENAELGNPPSMNPVNVSEEPPPATSGPSESTISVSATLAITPAFGQIEVGATFLFTVEVDPGSYAPDAAAAYLDFDPAIVQVETVTPAGPFDVILQRTFDNVAGHVDYAAGTFSATLASPAPLVQVRLRGIAPGVTVLNFAHAVPRASEVTAAGTVAPAELVSSTLSVVTSPPPVLRFSASAYTTTENAGVFAVPVVLAPAADVTVTVAYTAGALNGALAYAPGTSVQFIQMPIVDNSLHGPDEQVLLMLAEPTNAVLGAPIAAVLTIVDDDAPPSVQFSAAAYTVTENAGMAVIDVMLSAASAQTATVEYWIDSNLAGILVFAPGSFSQGFTTPVNDDGVQTPARIHSLALANPDGAILGDPAVALLTIMDDDPTPALSFLSTAYTSSESSSTASVTVTLSAASGFTVTVDYTAGETGGSLEFLPGVITQGIVVAVVDDSINGPSALIPLALTDPSHAVLGEPANTILTVLDDDPEPGLSFSSDQYAAADIDAAATLTVVLSSASGYTVTAVYTATVAERASAPEIAAVSGEIVFAPGMTVQTLVIPWEPDAAPVPGLQVVLTAATHAVLSAPASAALTIHPTERLRGVYLPLVTHTSPDESAPAPMPSTTPGAVEGQSLYLPLVTQQ